MPKKKKHSKEMKTEEAIKHLFTHRGHKHIKEHIEKLERLNTKKG
jgi:hypothetical protein